MTVSSQGREAASACNGVTRSFPCPFQFLSADDLAVIARVEATGVETVLDAGVDYSLTGTPDAATAAVVTTVAYPAGTTLVRRRVTALTQPLAYTPNDGFPAESHEQGLDRAMLAAQDIADDTADIAGRAALLPETSAARVAVIGKYPRVGPDGEFLFDDFSVSPEALAPFVGSFRHGRFTAAGGEAGVTVSEAVAVSGQVDLYLNGVRQEPGRDYLADGTATLALAAPLAAGDVLWWVHTGGRAVDGDRDELDGKVTRYPADPFSMLTSGYRHVLDRYERNFFDFANNKLRPVHGISAFTTGLPDDTLAQTSPWMWSAQIHVIANEAKRAAADGETATAAAAVSRIQGSWDAFKASFTLPADITSGVYGTNRMCGLSDDAAWFAFALALIHEATGDDSARGYGVEFIAAANIIFADPRQALVDSGVVTPGYNGSVPKAFKWCANGMLYAYAGDGGGNRTYGYVSTSCELLTALAALYFSQLPTSTSLTAPLKAALQGYALNVYGWHVAHMLTPAQADPSRAAADIVYLGLNLDPNVAAPNLAFTGSIAGTTLTVASGAGMAIGMTLDSDGPIGGIQWQTRVTAGAGSTWTVSKSQAWPAGGGSAAFVASLAAEGHGDANQVYLHGQNAYYGKPIRGLSAQYDNGTTALATLAARLYGLTGTAGYLALFKRIAAAYALPAAFGRFYPPLSADIADDGVPRVPVIGCMRDPWGNGQTMVEFATHLKALTAPGDFPLLKAAIVNTAKSLIARSRGGFLSPDWGGPEYNFVTGAQTWEEECARDYGGSEGGAQSRAEQAPTSDNALMVVQAGVVLRDFEVAYGSGVSTPYSIETLGAQVAALTVAQELADRPIQTYAPGVAIRWDANNLYLCTYINGRQALYLSNGKSSGVYGDFYVKQGFLHFTDDRYIGLNGNGDIYMNAANGMTFGGSAEGTPPVWNFGVANATVAYIGTDGIRAFGAFRSNGFYSFGVDNAYSFGEPSERATVVYATTATINTCDATEKTPRPATGDTAEGMFTVAELAAAKDIAALIRCFMRNDAIAEKGADHARWHFGPMAQDVAAAMQAHGLIPAGPLATSFRYAFLCWDAWEATPGVPAIAADPDNHIPARPAEPPRAAGSRYGLRTSEAQWFCIAAQEQRLRALEAA